MLTRMILKLLLKATLPLVAMVGITGYSIYLRGGDPLALLHQVSDGVGRQLSQVIGSVGRSAHTTLDAFPIAGDDTPVSETIYRWTDTTGTTHFSSTPPFGVDPVTTVQVDPNQNLIQGARPTEPEARSTPNVPGAVGVTLPDLDRQAQIHRMEAAAMGQ